MPWQEHSYAGCCFCGCLEGKVLCRLSNIFHWTAFADVANTWASTIAYGTSDGAVTARLFNFRLHTPYCTAQRARCSGRAGCCGRLTRTGQGAHGASEHRQPLHRFECCRLFGTAVYSVVDALVVKPFVLLPAADYSQATTTFRSFNLQFNKPKHWNDHSNNTTSAAV